YLDRLKKWGLEVAGANPVIRTNVALEANMVSEPMLAGFYYTTRSTAQGETFALSGVPEIATREGGVQIVARGDTSPNGMSQKLQCIMQTLGAHLSEMKLKWETATAVNIYTVFDVHPLLAGQLLPSVGAASHAGITWHYARPPVSGLDLEIDVRAVKMEL